MLVGTWGSCQAFHSFVWAAQRIRVAPELGYVPVFKSGIQEVGARESKMRVRESWAAWEIEPDPMNALSCTRFLPHNDVPGVTSCSWELYSCPLLTSQITSLVL